MTDINIGQISEALNDKTDRDFNNMNPSALSKETVVGWGMPDSGRVSSVTPNPYTATRDCVVYIVVTDATGGISHTISVDGVSIATLHTDYYVHQCTPVYLKQGSTLTMSTYSYVNAFRVFPLFGVE